MPRKLKGIGFLFTTETKTSEISRYAQLADRLGVDELWLGEAFISGNRHFRSYTPVAAQVLASTNRLRVGVGVTSPYIRHPALLAAEWATLDEMSGGRFMLGLGTMHQSLGRMGYDLGRARSVALFRQCLELIKAIASGQPVENDYFDVPYTYKGAVLGFEPFSKSIPIYLGVQNSKMLRLCGEVADGLIITTGESNLPAYVRSVIETVKDAARAANRDPGSIEYLAYPVISIADSFAEAEDKIIEHVCSRASREHAEAFVRHTNLAEEEAAEIKSLYRQGKLAEAEALTRKNRKLIEIFSITGTSDVCIERLLQLADAGVDKAILLLPTRTDVESDMRRIVRDVMPQVIEA